jgi:glucose-1-phosphatase
MKKVKFKRDIQTLIFDFGGVLYNIDPDATYKELLSKSCCPEMLSDKSVFSDNNTLFTNFEMGSLNSIQFRKKVINDYCLDVNEEEFDAIWNTMLVGVYPDSVNILTEYKKKYRLLLLSNTNEIHYNRFKSECSELFSIFERVYLSFEIGMRKPGEDIFEYVLKDSALEATECLFIDDSKVNIKGAEYVGMNTVLFEDRGSFRRIKEML